MHRREFLKAVAAAPLGGTLASLAGPALAAPRRPFAPEPGRWRTFELTTRVEIPDAAGVTRLWLPVPALDTEWQVSGESRWTGNAARVEIRDDPASGVRMLDATFPAGEKRPALELTSRVRTQDRAVRWSSRTPARLGPAEAARWTAPTKLLPTDGIVATTARDIAVGMRTDLEKARAIYEWIIVATYREPKVRGCGVGDVKAMLEAGNLGGKCADINALFVALCRAAGVPARDVYGIRVAPSAFGYKALGGNPANLTGAQHCRAEVFLQGHGWVAMDPADVDKVMREETATWIRSAADPVVRPVKARLFGGWEGNWVGFNTAHDVDLPGAKGPTLGFFMYPQCETGDGRRDCLDPASFVYSISASEVSV